LKGVLGNILSKYPSPPLNISDLFV